MNPQVDELGSILAQIAALEAQADAIKAQLRDAATAPGGASTFEGALFRAVISATNRSTTDWKAVTKACAIPADVIAAHTRTAAVFAVRTTAR